MKTPAKMLSISPPALLKYARQIKIVRLLILINYFSARSKCPSRDYISKEKAKRAPGVKATKPPPTGRQGTSAPRDLSRLLSLLGLLFLSGH